MLETIFLKFTEASEPLAVPAKGITIFVGPNNSGKSLVLREIEDDLSKHEEIKTKIVDRVEIAWPTVDQLEADIAIQQKRAPSNTPPGQVFIGRFNPDGSLDSLGVSRDRLIQFVRDKTQRRWVTSQFLRFFLIRLDGRTRFNLTNDQAREDLLRFPRNMLAHIFKDDELRAEIRAIVHDAFGVYFTVEVLSANHFRIRLSQSPPTEDEQNFNEAARIYHGAAMHIKDASDGVQAFVGIMCAVLSGDYRTLLVDEPEAFLHPPLARKLGYQLASKMSEKGGSLFASTHSPDFLIGCLQASQAVRVVRLEYSNGKSKGRIVDSAALGQLFKNPLMRSTNVMSALFHDGVVVTESDNDRVFYSEIYHRLADQEKGYPSLLFVNAQNKQTIQEIIRPLRSFGVPAAGIVDIDVLKDGGKTWTGWLEASQLPTALHNGLGQVRGDLHKKFVDKNVNMKIDGGVDALDAGDRAAAHDFFDKLEEYGLFAVRRGELENWLPNIKAQGKKTDWTISALEKMGSDPSSPHYLKPAVNDVWEFMRRIVVWIRNPGRKGT